MSTYLALDDELVSRAESEHLGYRVSKDAA